jgi:hypothetical protein
MKPTDAIQLLDNLRRSVLTVHGPSGPQPITGADHDALRQAIDTLRCEHPAEPPPAPKSVKTPKP